MKTQGSNTKTHHYKQDTFTLEALAREGYKHTRALLQGRLLSNLKGEEGGDDGRRENDSSVGFKGATTFQFIVRVEGMPEQCDLCVGMRVHALLLDVSKDRCH